MATAEQHRDISTQFLSHAEDELRKGDLLQASEKAWGAVSHYLNSIARQRNWPHGTHGLLIENAHRLISQEPASASDNLRLLRSTEALHANFYQAFLNKDSVEGGVEDAKRLIKVLEALNADK